MTQGPAHLCIFGHRKQKFFTLTWLKRAVENRKLFNSNRLKRSLMRNGVRRNRLKVLCNPGFPLYYILRNLGWLKSEKWWTNLSPRARRVNASKMVSERVAIFNEVRKWRKNPKAGCVAAPGACAPLGPAGQIPGLNQDGIKAPEYCNKCGLCCEVASGMPDFPAPAALPKRWREVFGNGLGRGHRFCPFLWEDNISGGGLCSIYPLRSNPCRLFGSEECDFFWKSTEPVELSSARKILLVGRWLINIVNPRKLPPVGPYSTAESPKFLEIDRI